MNNNALVSLINIKEVKNIIKIFEQDKKETNLVGGCVRDAFLGKHTYDIDIALDAKPDEIINILQKNKIQYQDFAYKYGSISTKINKYKFQITSLREDIMQIGRHTNIVFTNNWEKDAKRRDFTINSIYLSGDGKVKDYFNGLDHIKEKKIQFIGKIQSRIKEDYLRYFRYYRFLGLFNKSKINENYREILNEYNLEVYNYLSNEIIRHEILKMLNMSFPLNCFFENFKTMKKRSWLVLTQEQFIKTNYQLGLNKCLNKIDKLIN
tara:strand:- start:902 stop:1696 length:795 start_codon:yes stop_codon:yes gene_type:complete